MSNKIKVGIDFSMSSPGICIQYPDRYELHYLTSKKKFEGYIAGGTYGHAYPEYTSNEERFYKISLWVLDVLKECDPQLTEINIEGYAFAASGVITLIAEATGCTKQALYHKGYKFNLIAPTSVKKHFTGLGRADKDVMYQHFVEKTGFKLNGIFKSKSDKVGSPVSDMVDAYALSLYQSSDSTISEPVVII